MQAVHKAGLDVANTRLQTEYYMGKTTTLQNLELVLKRAQEQLQLWQKEESGASKAKPGTVRFATTCRFRERA